MDVLEFLEVIEEKLQVTINTLFWICEDLENAEDKKEIIYPTEYKIKLNVINDSFQYINDMIKNEIDKTKNIDISKCETLETELREVNKIRTVRR